MRFNVEIPDDDIRAAVEKQSELYRLDRLGRPSVAIERVIQEALAKSMREQDYSAHIMGLVDEIALKEIDKHVRKKVPGWVAQQVKEMLKYAKYRFLDKQDDQ